MRFLLDTNIVSNLIREPLGAVAERIKLVGENRVCTSIIVAAELRYGANMKGSPRLTNQVEAVLGVFDTLPFVYPGDEVYALIHSQLETAGTPISGNNMLLAAQAVTLDFTLVTDNESDFARINGLRIENWLGGS
jgi:tRNA(fMet)-specific endonuclease VapC